MSSARCSCQPASDVTGESDGRNRGHFKVDTGELFDRLQALSGDAEPLGTRLVSTLLTGQPSYGDALAMATYGVVLVEHAIPLQRRDGEKG